MIQPKNIDDSLSNTMPATVGLFFRVFFLLLSLWDTGRVTHLFCMQEQCSFIHSFMKKKTHTDEFPERESERKRERERRITYTNDRISGNKIIGYFLVCL